MPEYVIRRPCEECGQPHCAFAAVIEGKPVGWEKRKGAERHLEELRSMGWNVDGWEIEAR